MKGRTKLAAPLLVAIVALAVAGLPAQAATTNIGAVSEINNATRPDSITAGQGAGTWMVQIGEAAGTYAVPAGYGVITAWRHSTGGTAGNLTFKVYRPTGTPGQFFVVAADPRTVVPGTVHTFQVRIPVKPGDRIGISTTTVEVGYLCIGQLDTGMCADPAQQANHAGVFNFRQPDPPVGTNAQLDGPPFQGLRLDVAATVETDADKDGFGDDTQDACRTNAATQGRCPESYYLPPAAPGVPFFPGCVGSIQSIMRGTTGPDSITGTARGDRIFAGTGDDRVDGRAGDDCIDLGPGTDRGEGGAGADLELGGVGGDQLSGSDGADHLLGGPDGDNLLGASGNDRLTGDAGNDTLSGGSGDDRMHGVGGNDRLSGGSGRERMNGGAGKDVIAGGSSADRIAGDQGNDRVNGSSGNDSILGNSGADRLTGGSGRDRISGGTGNDRINARDGKRDRVACGKGRDTVIADRIDRVAGDCERRRR